MWTLFLACDAPEPPRPDDGTTEVTWDEARLSVSLLDVGERNALLPDLIAGDVAGRRAWLHATDRTLAAVHLDTGELTTVVQLAIGTAPTAISVDAGGAVWLAADEGVVVYDPRTDRAVALEAGDRTVTRVFGLEAGAALAAGTGADGAWLARVTVDDGVGEVHTLGGTLGAVAISDTHAAIVHELVEGDPTLTIVDLASLEVLEACDAPMLATRMTALPGAWGMSSPTQVARVDCASGLAASIEAGESNAAIVAVGEDVWVFDLGQSLAGGLARRFDLSLVETDTFDTPPHTPSAWYDATAAQLWMVGEDVSLLRTATSEGATVRDVRLGEHVEAVVADPEHPDRSFFTGRLTSTVGRVDLASGEVVVARDVGVWPIEPVVAEGRLWVLDQSDTILRALDPETLAITQEVDLDRPNALRVFGDLAFSAERGTLWLTDTAANELVEVDPDTGLELAAFPLAGGPVRGAATVGRAELLLGADAAWVVRTSDGVVTRVSFEDGTTVEGAVDGLGGRLQAAWLDADVLAVGGTILDAGSLELLSRLPVDQVLDRHAGGWIGWSDVTHAVVVLDEDGDTVGQYPLDEARRVPNLLWNTDTRQITWATFETASVSRQGLGAWIETLAP